MSGFGAPAFTDMPISDVTRSTRLPGSASPASIRSSSAPAAMMMTSAGSSRASRLGMASGAGPIDEP
jgi:hypothetical protein